MIQQRIYYILENGALKFFLFFVSEMFFLFRIYY